MEIQIRYCDHIKANGLRCASPALRGERFCYFHLHRLERDRRRLRNAKPKPLSLPPLEDANAVQLGLMNVLDAIAHNSIDTKQAALLLYGLQTAAINLKRVDFEPYMLRDWARRQAQAEAAEQAIRQAEEQQARLAAAPKPVQKVEQHPTPDELDAAAEALFRASGT